jgi:uncharacterized protein involved in exopolysaccharide biosynthesis
MNARIDPSSIVGGRIVGEEEFSLADVFKILWSQRLKVLGIPVLTAALALAISFLMPQYYTATARILPPQQAPSLSAMFLQQVGALAGLAGVALKNPNDQFVAMMMSRTVADRIIDRFDLIKVYESEYRQDARKELASNTAIVAGRDGLIIIDFDDRESKRAAEIANAYIDELRTMMQALALSEAAQRRSFFEARLKDARGKLSAAEAELTSGGFSEKVLKAEPRAAAETVARLRAEITGAEVMLSTMRNSLSEGHPEMKQAQSRLASLRAQLRVAQQADTGPSGKDEDGYIARFREFKYQESLYELLAKQYELARVDEAREATVIQVVDIAVEPERHSKPYKALIAAAAGLLGLVGAIIWILSRSSRDRNLRLALQSLPRTPVPSSAPQHATTMSAATDRTVSTGAAVRKH